MWSRCGAEDVVLHDCLAIRTDYGRGHLASRHCRRDPTLAVNCQGRILPTKIGALLLDAPWNERVVSRFAVIGRVFFLLMFVPGCHPIEAFAVLGIVDLDVVAVALRSPRRMTRVALHGVHVQAGGVLG